MCGAMAEQLTLPRLTIHSSRRRIAARLMRNLYIPGSARVLLSGDLGVSGISLKVLQVAFLQACVVFILCFVYGALCAALRRWVCASYVIRIARVLVIVQAVSGVVALGVILVWVQRFSVASLWDYGKLVATATYEAGWIFVLLILNIAIATSCARMVAHQPRRLDV